jgi:endoglucanase
VQAHGQLHVCGKRLCNQSNQEVQLRGMSTHGIQWYGWGNVGSGSCLTTGSLDTLAKDFRADLLRISMYIQEDGYETDPAAFTAQVETLIDEVTQRGMYAIVDWHMLNPGDPNYNLARAKTFFTHIAKKYGHQNNILYDIANEPNSETSVVTWAKVRAYHEAVIPVIRAHAPNAVILLGSHGWSTLGFSDSGDPQSYMEVVNNPVSAANVMYGFHFYAASHGQAHRNLLSAAADKLPMFVTEFGTQEASGDGANNFASTQQWLDLLAARKISWANWNYSDDPRTGAVWRVGSCAGGTFTEGNLKDAGKWVRDKLRNR